ncbi:MAG: nicotinate (nicotinamide) nucleotide adenylyltransferase [Aquificaceae bacterium]|nr:nicotinate (nicotinamide) nucleotide adenylyltransferase [Aquificaceae bacterium]MDW8237493.1 nicotinate (nicotinamide) nucleotide adenylyltransferase [Aquificaceae bacterium]
MQIFFGGSFDPVHLGHLIVARDALEILGFERLVFIPAFQVPLKQPHLASPEDRFNMLLLATASEPGFCVNSIEIRRGGISYTVDTAIELKQQLGYRPWFLMGEDSFKSIHLWKNSKELLKTARIVVVRRYKNSEDIESYIKERFPWLLIGEDVLVIKTRLLEISSTEIRNRLKEGKSINWLVPERVCDYITKNNLYRY